MKSCKNSRNDVHPYDISRITFRAYLDVDIQAKNSELVFGLVQSDCLDGRGIATWN
jgi:hypothetical protein